MRIRRKKSKRANGAGSCFQRPNGTWVARDAARTVERTGKTMREAVDALHVELARRGQAQTSDSEVTVAATAEQWLTRRLNTGDLRPTTWNVYRGLIERYLTPAIGKRLLTSIDEADIQRIIDDALTRGSAHVATKLFYVVSDIFERARKAKLIGTNPCVDVVVLKAAHAEIKPYATTALAKFLAAARIDRLEALWVLAVAAGCRRSELLALDVTEDLRLWQDEPAGPWRATITIRRGLQRVPILERAGGAGPKSRLQFLPPKSRKGYRTIELPPVAIESLRKWLAAREAERVEAGDYWEEHGLLFCHRLGGPLEPRNVGRSFKRLLAAAGLDEGQLKGLRHTAASMMLRDGVDVKTVQSVMGHATASMTLDRYGHLMAGTSPIAAAKMNAALNALKTD